MLNLIQFNPKPFDSIYYGLIKDKNLFGQTFVFDSIALMLFVPINYIWKVSMQKYKDLARIWTLKIPFISWAIDSGIPIWTGVRKLKDSFKLKVYENFYYLKTPGQKRNLNNNASQTWQLSHFMQYQILHGIASIWISLFDGNNIYFENVKKNEYFLQTFFYFYHQNNRNIEYEQKLKEL